MTYSCYIIRVSYEVVHLSQQRTLCHRDELVSPTYEIGILLLCHTDEISSLTYEIAMSLISLS